MSTTNRLLFACWALCLVACAETATDGPRSVVLVTLDTTRQDALGSFGGRADTTPNLDALASRSVRYPWARTVTPLTLPAHASMFTGLYPPRHGVRGNGPMVLTEATDTLAERAKAAGFETAGFVAALALDRAFGIAQGFDAWTQPQPTTQRAPGQIADRAADEVVTTALRWLEVRDPALRFFLWIHLFDPHAPYLPHAGMPDELDDYLGEVAYMDRALGRLFEELDRLPEDQRPVIAVIGDHGEGRGQHGEATHGIFCYDSTLRVPFFLHYPSGYRAGEVSEEIVSVTDVFPTLLTCMGLSVPEGIDGIDLAADRVPADRGVYFESYHGWQRFGWSPLVGWADAEGKYVHDSAPQFFRTSLDEDEATDRIDELPEHYRAAIHALSALPRLEHENESTVTSEVLSELSKLGYGDLSPEPLAFPAPLEGDGRPAARERLGEYEDFVRAHDQVLAGNHADAAPTLERIVQENPWHVGALESLAMARIALGEHDRAIPVLFKRLALPPEKIATHRDLMICYKAIGNEAAARSHTIRSLELMIATYERQQREREAQEARELLKAILSSTAPGEQ